MDIQTSKLELMKMILDIEDSSMINKIRKMISREKNDFYDNFSEDEKLEIQYGIDQLDRGESISWEELRKKLP